MKKEYEQWIRKNSLADNTGMCEKLSVKMADYFPELTKVKGTVTIIGPFGSQHTAPHHWCEDVDGTVVDPTADQFVSVLKYKRIDGRITGKCPNCGEYCLDGEMLCSEECSEEYLAYLNAV